MATKAQILKLSIKPASVEYAHCLKSLSDIGSNDLNDIQRMYDVAPCKISTHLLAKSVSPTPDEYVYPILSLLIWVCGLKTICTYIAVFLCLISLSSSEMIPSGQQELTGNIVERPGSPHDTESTSLLSQSTNQHQSERRWESLRQWFSRHIRQWKVVYLIAIFFFVIEFGENLRVVPELRLLELALCRRYYSRHDSSLIDEHGNVNEAYCKLDVLQGELAMLRGWMSLLKGLIQLLLVLPYGVVADSKGRKIVIILSEIGLIISYIWVFVVCIFYQIFPVEAIWASALFLVIGGGSPVLNAVAFAVLADSVEPEKRTSAFFYASTANLAVELLAPPLGARLMTVTTLYKALIVGFIIEISGLFVLILLPETLRVKPSPEGLVAINETDPLLSRTRESEVPEARKGSIEKLFYTIQDMSKPLRNMIKLIITDWNVLLAFPAFLVNHLSRQVTAVLLQYLSKRLGWNLASTSYLMSIRPAVNMVLFPFVIPAINHLLIHNLNYTSPKADLTVAKFSSVALVAGCLILGVAESLLLITLGLLVFSLGWGFNNSVQLFVTSRVEKNQVAVLYTALFFMDAIGGLVGPPLLAASFSAGLKFQGALFGLPLLVAAAIFTFASSGIWFLSA